MHTCGSGVPLVLKLWVSATTSIEGELASGAGWTVALASVRFSHQNPYKCVNYTLHTVNATSGTTNDSIQICQELTESGYLAGCVGSWTDKCHIFIQQGNYGSAELQFIPLSPLIMVFAWVQGIFCPYLQAESRAASLCPAIGGRTTTRVSPGTKPRVGLVSCFMPFEWAVQNLVIAFIRILQEREYCNKKCVNDLFKLCEGYVNGFITPISPHFQPLFILLCASVLPVVTPLVKCQVPALHRV